jgi:oxygen-independent coproporphyrinogen-3 oxidase
MDIGLYIHVPFCAHKCGYCDFYSHRPEARITSDFVDAACRELAQPLLDGRHRVETIFIGGGTPSLLSVEQWHRLLEPLKRIVERDRPAEFTVEANPESFTRPRAEALREAGVNRISMGAQTFDAKQLIVLERIHDAADTETAAQLARDVGFEHLNLDLIFGIPGQSTKSLAQSIDRAVTLDPDHVACYGLTYEPDTPMRDSLDAGRVRPVSEPRSCEMYDTMVRRLGERGYEQYEISNFARPGGKCQHNLRYWHNQPTIGIGPSAASYVDGKRWRNVPDTAEYIRRVRVGESITIDEETLSPTDRAGETAMLMLRLVEGIDRSRFRDQTGFDPLVLFADVLVGHREAGLLEVGPDRIALTPKGRLLGDQVMADFLMPQSV